MLSLLLPRRCPCCQQALLPAEGPVCLKCLAKLPRIHAEFPDNVVEERLFGQFPFEHGTSFAYYRHDGLMAHVVVQSKYLSRPWTDAQLTQLFVQELRLAQSPWPFDIEVIVPVPVHWLRLLKRGYNQTMSIAETLHEAWQLPIETHCLRKTHSTHSQVGLSREERLFGMRGAFSVAMPERLAGRHVLLVDDVLTTGATLVSAADALLASVPNIRLSFLTLATAAT